MDTVNNPTPDRSLLSEVPNSTAVLVLGIISIATCWTNGLIGIILGIIALALSNSGNAAYLSAPEKYTASSYNNLKTGKICAIIGISLSGLFLLVLLAVLSFAFSSVITTLPWLSHLQ